MQIQQSPNRPPSAQTPVAFRCLGMLYAGAGYLGFFGAYAAFVLTTMGYTEAWGLSLAPSLDATWLALLFNFGLILVFGVQHTVMARPSFKTRLVRLVPEPLERATFVWASNIALTLVSLFWARVPGTVWSVQQPVVDWTLWGIGVLGWVAVAGASFLIDHFELFGLSQAYAWLRGKTLSSGPFRTPGAYKVVRHPMMVGMLVGLWATPQMDSVRLVLASMMTAYIVIGVRFEERDLVRQFGDRYRRYQDVMPALIPRLTPAAVTEDEAVPASTTLKGASA